MATFTKIAHRGASGNFPENTRLAFEKAIEARVDMIEFDCQLTKDGHVVVFHDERLERTARAKGVVRNHTLAELKKLDIGEWRKRAHKGERVLTLEELLDLVGQRVNLCLDIKQFPESLPGIELKLLFILSHYDYLDRAVLSSFDYRCLDRVRELAPEARLGVIFASGGAQDPFVAARRLTATSILVQKELATREFLQQAWDDGLDVYVWTVNELREMEKFASVGVQGIISDFPERFWKLKWS
ncbi:MAG: glycerophosphodiester phosphodiesterase [Alphaproteobacteria bacterium]